LKIAALKKKSGRKANEDGVTNTEHRLFVCPHFTAVGRSAPHRENSCFFDPKKMTDYKDWACKLMDDKGVVYKDNE